MKTLPESECHDLENVYILKRLGKITLICESATTTAKNKNLSASVHLLIQTQTAYENR